MACLKNNVIYNYRVPNKGDWLSFKVLGLAKVIDFEKEDSKVYIKLMWSLWGDIQRYEFRISKYSEE